MQVAVRLVSHNRVNGSQKLSAGDFLLVATWINGDPDQRIRGRKAPMIDLDRRPARFVGSANTSCDAQT